jgi:S1-C subfamily serine protease
VTEYKLLRLLNHIFTKKLHANLVCLSFALGLVVLVSEPLNANANPQDLSKLEQRAIKGDQSALSTLIHRSKADRSASRALGVIFFKGLGVPRNIARALEFFEQSATLGDKQSITFLAKYYAAENSPYRDAEKARFYQDLAFQSSSTREPDLPSSPSTYSKKFSWKPFVEPDATPRASGSGFAINDGGGFVTNHHVVEGCKKLVVVYNDKKAYAETLASSKELDLAVISVKAPTPYYLTLRNKTPAIGESVKAAGYPRGYFKFSEGIISATKPESVDFQFSASISSGSSGGPIVDQSSVVVGVARGGIAPGKDESGSVNGADFNFAIDSVYLTKFLGNNNIPYKQSSAQHKLIESDIARILQKTAVFIICY